MELIKWGKVILSVNQLYDRQNCSVQSSFHLVGHCMLLSWWNHLDSFLGNIVRGPMDFNLKSKLWAGNIYQQFESICHDVDEFVNKDTVKFVGNQVQNVGISVKRLYSNVVQDVLPLSGNIVKPERQAGEQGDMQDRVSVTGIRTTSTCTDEKQLPKNQVSNDHKMQISKAANTPESQTCQYFRDNVNAIVQNSEDNSDTEKTVTKDLKSVTANSSFDGEIFSRKCDEDYISSSPVFSADGEGSTSIEKERRYFSYQKVDKGFSDGMGFYETSSNGWLSKSMLSVFEDPYFDENGSLSSPPLPVSTHRVNVDNCPLIDTPLPLACDVDDWASEKDRVLCGSCYTKHESVDLSTSDQSSEQPHSYHSYNEKEQILIMPSTYYASPKSPITVESTSADFSKKVENVLHSRSVSDSVSAASSINDADTTNEAASADFSKKAENVLHSRSVSDGCTYNISAASSVNAADTKALDVEPFFPILESNDNNALQTNRPDILIGSSESRQEEHCRSKIVTSPSETENTYVLSVPNGDLDLESIDLSSNSKHDRRSVVLNSNFVLAGSYRRRNFRYYKNIIKGAFTSQKRLSKEYEHLAIMYGDIDVESNQHFEPSSLCSFPNTALHVAGTRLSQEMKDEWELL